MPKDIGYNSTTTSNLSNSKAKDGLLNDVQIKRKKHRRRAAKPKSLRKTIFGPHTTT